MRIRYTFFLNILFTLFNSIYGNSDSLEILYNIALDVNSNKADSIMLEALRFENESKNDTIICNIYIHLSKSVGRSYNLEKSKYYIEKALETCADLNDSIISYNVFSIIGSYNYRIKSIDLAKYYFQKAKEYLCCKLKYEKAAIDNNIANCLRDENKLDSALIFYANASNEFNKIGEIKASNACEINISSVYIRKNQLKRAKRKLNYALKTSICNNWIDHQFKIYDLKIQLIAKERNIPSLINIVDSIAQLEHNDMLKSLQSAEVKYESKIREKENRILKIESKKNRLLLIILLGILIFIMIISFLFLKNQKVKSILREANITIEKQSALSEERTRIASEMHDDLGGGLTTIKFLSQKVLRKTKDDVIKNQVKKIVSQSETLVNNMSEIIWAMNAGFDTLSSLISYSRRYAHEFLEDYDIDLSFQVEGKATNIKLTGTERRNMFLVIKEVLHNTVKHAQADKLDIKFSIAKDLKISIQDNGVGIEEEKELGNGLKNMKARMERIGGTYQTVNQQGLKTELTFPIRRAQSE